MADFNEELMPAMQEAINSVADTVYGDEWSESRRGFMNLLWETIKQETLGGQDILGKLSSRNINQITSIFIKDYNRLKRLAASQGGLQNINPDEFHIRLNENGQPDISDPYTNIAMTAVGYIAKTKGFEGINLTSPENRASTWKKHHNTMLGAGTEEEYMDKVKHGPQILWGQGMLNKMGPPRLPMAQRYFPPAELLTNRFRRIEPSEDITRWWERK